MPNEEMTKVVHQASPLCATLRMDVDELTKERVVMSTDWAADLTTANGLLHGGYIMALADSSGAVLASANLPADAVGTSTIESKTNFLGAVREGRVTATSTPLHIGTTTIVVETDIRRADGKLVAKVTQTQIVLRAKG